MALAAAGAVGLSALIGFSAPAQAAEPTTIQLLTFNDFHGRIANVPVNGATPEVPGAAKLFGLVDQLRAQLPTTVVAAGDLIGASTFPSAVLDDQPTIDVMNAGGLDVSSVGNHEFDRGYDDLVNRVIPSADYPYLGANVYLNGEHALDSYFVNEVGGLKVGYIGVVTVQTPSLVSPAGIVGLTFTDPVLEANRVAAQLKDGDPANGEADVVVLMAHEGAAAESVVGDCLGVYNDPTFSRFAQSSAAIDAIVSGHTHQSYAYQMPVPGLAKTRPVIQANEYSNKLGRITLTFDGATVTSSTAELLDPVSATPNAAVQAVVAAAVAESAVLGAEPVGTVLASFPPVSDRGLEYPTSNLLPTAQLEQTGADIAFINPGGVRTGLGYPQSGSEGNGVVTYAEAFAVQPFANDVVTITMTGAQIVEALEQQVQPLNAATGAPLTRPFLHLGVSSNFAYTYRYQASAQSSLGKLQVMTATLDGSPLDPAGTYRVTVNAFLAAGGDNFPAFKKGTGLVTSAQNDIALFVAYLQANPALDPTGFGPFSQLVAGTPDGAGGPGAPVVPPAPLTPMPCPAAEATAAIALSVSTAKPGDTIHVIGTDFAPFETVVATLHSEPLAVGTSVASESGVVEFDVVLGDAMTAGDHSVRLVGLGSDIDIAAGFVVEALPILAATGGREQQGLTLGVILVLLGSAALVAGRRRPADPA